MSDSRYIVSSHEANPMKHRGYYFRIRAKLPELDNAFEKYTKLVQDKSQIIPIIPTPKPKIVSNEVFIVHGHNEEIKEKVARFLEKLELKPLILHEQPNGGRTLIEKFEQNASKVGFAIVLMTSDDFGGEAISPTSSKPRARQNVILEQGYFLGSLSRKNVCVLYMEGVELPSDLLGVVYVPLDDKDAWKLQLAKEIKNAGIEIDLNKVLD